MIKVILKISENEINPLLGKLAKLGIRDIKIKEKEKKTVIFQYKNIIEDLHNELKNKS